MKASYLIRTNALDSDERFNKTCAFLSEIGNEIDVFAIVKRQSAGVSENWIQQELRLRSLFGGGNLVAFKYVELLLRAAWFLASNQGRRWYANFDFLPLHVLTAVLARRDTRPIWDLHEMPPEFVARNPILRRIFSFLLSRSHVIVCNEARREAMEALFGVELPDACVLRNYPALSATQTLVRERLAFLESAAATNDQYRIVITGGNAPGRYVPESIDVIASIREKTGIPLEVVLVGGAPIDHPAGFVKSTGFIPFEELLRRSVVGSISLCFYKTDSRNNWLCEPNRFYQAVTAGQHVLTFDHPSLENVRYAYHHIVDEKDFAASLEAKLLSLLSDSTDPKERLYKAGWECQLSSAVFENQLPAFSSWYPS